MDDSKTPQSHHTQESQGRLSPSGSTPSQFTQDFRLSVIAPITQKDRTSSDPEEGPYVDVNYDPRASVLDEVFGLASSVQASNIIDSPPAAQHAVPQSMENQPHFTASGTNDTRTTGAPQTETPSAQEIPRCKDVRSRSTSARLSAESDTTKEFMSYLAYTQYNTPAPSATSGEGGQVQGNNLAPHETTSSQGAMSITPLPRESEAEARPSAASSSALSDPARTPPSTTQQPSQPNLLSRSRFAASHDLGFGSRSSFDIDTSAFPQDGTRLYGFTTQIQSEARRHGDDPLHECTASCLDALAACVETCVNLTRRDKRDGNRHQGNSERD